MSLSIFHGSVSPTVTVSPSKGTLTLDLSLGQVFITTLTESVILSVVNTPSSPNTALSFILYTIQDDKGGWAITLPKDMIWRGQAPAQDIAPSKISIYDFFTIDCATWHGVMVENSTSDSISDSNEIHWTKDSHSKIANIARADNSLRITGSGLSINIGGVDSDHLGSNVVTYSKIQQVAPVSLLGNPTGSVANQREIILGEGLCFIGSSLVATGTYTDHFAVRAVQSTVHNTNGLVWNLDSDNTDVAIKLDGDTLHLSKDGLRVSDTGIGYAQLNVSNKPASGQVLSYDGKILTWVDNGGGTVYKDIDSISAIATGGSAGVEAGLQPSLTINWSYDKTTHAITGSIVDSSITKYLLAPNSVTAAAIADSNIAASKLDIVNNEIDGGLLSWSKFDRKMKWVPNTSKANAVQAGFDLQNRSPFVTRDLYGLFATSLAASQIIYLRNTKYSGKYYISSQYTSGNLSIGFDFAHLSLTTVDFGSRAGSFGMKVWGSDSGNRSILANGSTTYTSKGYSSVVGQNAHFAIDIDAGKIWMSYYGNDGYWLGGGDPDSGTSPTVTFTPRTPVRFGVYMADKGVTVGIHPADAYIFSNRPTTFDTWT